MKFGETSALSTVVYSLVGLAGLYQALTWKSIQRRWHGDAGRRPGVRLSEYREKIERRNEMTHYLPILLAGALAMTVCLLCRFRQRDIVDTAIAGKFNTLVAAVKAAGLVDTLKGPGPFTVFAPTDEAFAKLPPGTLESLLKPENKAKLQSILTYHVVAGRVMAQGRDEARFGEDRGRPERRRSRP